MIFVLVQRIVLTSWERPSRSTSGAGTDEPAVPVNESKVWVSSRLDQFFSTLHQVYGSAKACVWKETSPVLLESSKGCKHPVAFVIWVGWRFVASSPAPFKVSYLPNDGFCLP
jgi:hypothetical protein